MPNITIREYDKTSAGVGLYANFSVLVPGYCKPREYVEKKKAYMYGGREVFEAESSAVVDEGKEIWDENGVYEFSSQSDFVAKIGKQAATEGIIVPAVAPSDVIIRKLTDQLEFENLVADEKLYTISQNEDPTDIGELRDAKYVYTPVNEDDTWDEEADYAIIEPSKRGSDLVNALHYGNQIAYELLGLGYTVLYKKLEVNSDLNDGEYWEGLKDKAVYDFRYVITGVLDNNEAANNAIIALCHAYNETNGSNGRGDCIALVDIPKSAYDGLSQTKAIPEIISAANGITASKYAAIFAPFVTYRNFLDKDGKFIDTDYLNATFPASFHYLACAAKAAEDYNEWYAIAGYTRGVSNYSINSLGCKFGEAAVQALEPRTDATTIEHAVNLVIKVKSNYYLWGNRTAEKLGEELRASHFLNIRQLCSTIKKQVYVTCRRFTFDPNSDVLWVNFCNAIRPVLEKMKADQGITDYKFVKVKTDQKAVLKAKIRIVPIEAVEDFDISLMLEDSISGVTTGIDEE